LYILTTSFFPLFRGDFITGGSVLLDDLGSILFYDL